MKSLTLVTMLLFVSAAGLGQTYTNANLNGNYAFQTTSPRVASWSKKWTCSSGGVNAWYTVTGSATVLQVSYGVITFNGAGSATSVFTQEGQVNIAASANTTSVQWDSVCNVISINPGYVVYYAPAQQTYTGTYSIQSTGYGTLSANGQLLNILLAGTNTNGTSTTVMISSQQKNNQTLTAGTATLQ